MQRELDLEPATYLRWCQGNSAQEDVEPSEPGIGPLQRGDAQMHACCSAHGIYCTLRQLQPGSLGPCAGRSV